MRAFSVLALGVLAVAAAAPAAIEPQRGIGGVRLGMSQVTVRSALGHPTKIERGSNEIGPYTTYRYPRVTVTFFAGRRVTSVVTTSPLERTLRGVGVGSTVAQVSKRLAGIRCVREFGYRHCYVGEWAPGKIVTDFAIRDGRVTRVTVGYVID